MIRILVLSACVFASSIPAQQVPARRLADTLVVRRAERIPVFDGRASREEYGDPAATIVTRAGTVTIWARRVDGVVYLAALLPDSTFYWGDDFVISLDPVGDGTPAPGHDDVQWYFRRTLDSSVVFSGRHGRWMSPGDDPNWRLGVRRSLEQGWEVRSTSWASGWSVELRLDLAWLAGDGTGRPAIAFRTYNDAPGGWWTWPVAADLRQPTELERRPDRWALVEADRP